MSTHEPTGVPNDDVPGREVSSVPETPLTPEPQAAQEAQEAQTGDAQQADVSPELNGVPQAPEASAGLPEEPVAPVEPEEPVEAAEPEAPEHPKDPEPAPAPEQAAQAPAPTDVGPAPAAPTRPAPKPAPRPGPPKGLAKPRPPRAHKQAPIAPPVPPVDSAAAAEATKWGRVDDEGNVYLRSSEGERLVGQFAAEGSPDDALGIYVRRFLDLQAQVGLLESRVENINASEATGSLQSLEEALVEPAVVGDVESLRDRVSKLKGRIEERRAEQAQEREAAKAEAVKNRTAIIERAEAISGQDPAKTHWRDSRTELTGLLDQWKDAQRNGPRIDRPVEDELWQRFSRARTKFDRQRRQHFSELDSQRSEVVAKKEQLIAEAEALSSSTEWGPTSAKYRGLMDQWRAAGRANRKDDDALWERFRGAQQSFFDARNAHFKEVDSEQSDNLKAKLALVARAEKLVPVTDIAAAKKQLHAIQDEWEQIGYVPSKDMSRTEGRLREIENQVRRAEDDQWKKSDPTRTERASSFSQQLQDIISKLEDDVEQARARGNTQKLREAEEALATRRAWLEQVEKNS